MIDKRLMNIDDALSRLMGSVKLYRKLLDKFLQSTDFESLRQSISAGDNVRCDEISHAIKGVAGNLSLTALYELSSTLMVQFREKRPEEAVIADFWKVKDETFDAVKEYLSQNV